MLFQELGQQRGSGLPILPSEGGLRLAKGNPERPARRAQENHGEDEPLQLSEHLQSEIRSKRVGTS